MKNLKKKKKNQVLINNTPIKTTKVEVRKGFTI